MNHTTKDTEPAAPGLAIALLGTAPGDGDAVRAMLCDLLVEAVEHGASVTFMHPLAAGEARRFWDDTLAAAARGERLVLGAFDGPLLVGTVTLRLDVPENQRHRAEVVKLLTRVSHRGRGVATSLMRALEEHAAARGCTLLVLDTAADGGASRLYEKLGYILLGEIPDYALTPRGNMTAARFYWKRIGPAAEGAPAS
ncbi:GCN5-related N-acetyltransferase [Desulfovibrio sp. X2]|uniref:GNAT family N-acetyltransferase n=1 Tax=Desulfovibrio sp. X2 TaxID=941449 RepID=UPI0003588E99|nr:GNAT family N-acetyltransferase [Desulfovibrio sp. X2]EPR39781.1 GCN5-related N-acetyltransferase [Desulfovibrio sp. X2]